MIIRGLDKKNVWKYENGFHWFSDPSRIQKFVGQYELYKSVAHLNADIIEFGVFKGASLIRFAAFRQALGKENDSKIIGFDAFGEFPRTNLGYDHDHAFITKFEKESGDGLHKSQLSDLITTKGYKNIELIDGNVFTTLPLFLEQNHDLKVSLLHLDLDVFEPTKLVLDLLVKHVVPGGIIVFDDYDSVLGETIAANDFAKREGLKIQKQLGVLTPAFIRLP